MTQTPTPEREVEDVARIIQKHVFGFTEPAPETHIDIRLAARDIIALILSRRAGEGGEGWVLVPREPTEAMCESAWRDTTAATPEERMLLELADNRQAFLNKAARRYRAMIQAAPPHPQDSKEEG